MLKPFLGNSTRNRRRQYFRQFCCYNFRPEVDNDVISGVVVDNAGMDVHVKFGYSRSNGSRDIRGADFVSNEHIKAYHIRQNRHTGVSPKHLSVATS